MLDKCAQWRTCLHLHKCEEWWDTDRYERVRKVFIMVTMIVLHCTSLDKVELVRTDRSHTGAAALLGPRGPTVLPLVHCGPNAVSRLYIV